MAKRILVTGASGFIAKHITLQLLQNGYSVRGTLRALNKADQIKRTLTDAGVMINELSFTAADLVKDDGWAEAIEGCDAVMHVASPFPIAQPRDRDALTPAARDGTLRVLRAAKDVERIILTSSMVAMMYRPGRRDVVSVGENDWTDIDWPALSAYIVSKTEAEKAAWAEADKEGFKERLTTINPGLVFGPALDDDIGASLDLVRLLMTGAYPALPPVSYPIVDVRDVAALHIKALETAETGGRRLIAASETLSLAGVAKALKEATPEHARKISDRTLPALVVRLAALFDRNLASVVPDLGGAPHADTAYVKALTGLDFRTAREAVAEAARSLIRIKAV